MKLKHGLSTIALVLVFFGCNIDDIKFDDVYLEEATPIYALEVGFAQYTMSELLEELDSSTLTIDSTSSDVLELRFDFDPVTVSKGDVLDDTEIIEIEPVDESKTLRPFRSIDLSPVNGTLTNIFAQPKTLQELLNDYAALPIPINLNIDPDDLIDTLKFDFVPDSGTVVDEIYFDGGFFRFVLSGLDFQYNLTALNTFDIASRTPLSLNQNRNELEPIQLQNNYVDFAAVRDPADPSDDELNTVQFELNVRDFILQPGESITNNTPVSIEVLTGEIDVNTFLSVTGSFREQTFDVDSQRISFSAIDEFTGTIEFTDPRVEFYIENYIGIPISLDLSGVQVVTSADPDGTPLVIKDPTIGDISPVTTFDPFYQNIVPVADTIAINKVTTNVDEIFADIPNEFIVSVTASMLNEPGSFATIPENSEDALMELSGQAILPLEARITDLQQDFDFDGIDSEEITEGDSVRLQIAYKNSIPIEIYARVGFVTNIVRDVNDEVISADTTFASQELIITQNVTEELFDQTDETTLEPAFFALDETEIDQLIDAETIAIRLTINSPAGSVTSLTTNQKIFFRLAALAGFNIDLSND